MKRIGLKVSSTLATALLVVLAMGLPNRSVAQVAADASVHGHVNNAVGQAVNQGEVRLSTDRSSPPAERKYQYKFPLDQNGDFKGTVLHLEIMFSSCFRATRASTSSKA